MRDQVQTSYNMSPVEMVSKAIGGVARLGWVSPATILIDQTLNEYDIVWAAAGHIHAVYPTKFAELVKVTNAQPMVVGE